MMNLIAVLIFSGVSLAILALWHTRRGAQPEEQAPPAEQCAGLMDRWEAAARRAGLRWRRTDYYIVIGSTVAVAIILASTGRTAAAFALALLGATAPCGYVYRKQAARSAAFVRQLPQALFLASSVLRAGGTLLQAVDAIATQMSDPIGHEFRLIQRQMRLQVPAHEALAEAQERIGIREFAAVVVAARITAEAGGNLAHIFDQISRSIMEAQNARRTINAFTTEGRLSANLIAAMPLLVMGLLHLLSPGYFAPLMKSAAGQLVLAGCLGTILVGWLIIRRMIDIRTF